MMHCAADKDWETELTSLAEALVKVQRFYDALGGIVGYQLKCLQLICDAKVQQYHDSMDSGTAAETDDSVVDYLKPQGPNFQGESGRLAAQQAAGEGLRALPALAEVYPLGGTSSNSSLSLSQPRSLSLSLSLSLCRAQVLCA